MSLNNAAPDVILGAMRFKVSLVAFSGWSENTCIQCFFLIPPLVHKNK